MTEVTYWQTNGLKVQIPSNKLREFERAVKDNTIDDLFSEEMETAKQVHYEGDMVCTREIT